MMYSFGSFRLDPEERRLYRDGKAVSLQPGVLKLLTLLVANAGRLQTREALVEAMWSRTIVVEHSLTVSIGKLRKALGDDEKSPRYIETVARSGYRFIAPVTVEQPETAKPGRQRRRLWFRFGAAGLVVLCIAAGICAWIFTRPAPAPSGRQTTASIAVLPFLNLSDDPANAYFVAGIQDEILTRLAAIRSLKVISRTSAARYPSRPADLPTVARQLGVATLLEGSVQKTGGKVRINVQLIDAQSRAHIWAQSYDRPLADVLGVEGEVAQKIAGALSAKLLPQEAARIARLPTRNPEAWLLYLKARYLDDQVFGLSNAPDPDAALARAAALYRQAIAKDPHFAVAWARLSILEGKQYWYKVRSEKIAASAKQAAIRALLLDPDLPLAHVAMGYAAYFGARDYPLALAQFELARKGLPNNADVIAAIAFIHRRQGKWGPALAGLQQALALDRRNPFRYVEIGATLGLLRDYPGAESYFRQALAIEPQDYSATIWRLIMLVPAGRLQLARRLTYEIPDGPKPPDYIFAARFKLAWLERRPDEALSVLHGAPATVRAVFLPFYVPTSLLRAKAWALKGDPERARAAYEQARESLQEELKRDPQSPTAWSALGFAAAGLGKKQEAIEAGLRATRLLPVSRDAVEGAAYLAALARIYSRLNDPAQAVRLLDQLLAMPAGQIVSIAMLKLDPDSDPIRNDPRFKALLKKYHREAPVPLTAGAKSASSQAKNSPRVSANGDFVST